MATAVEESAKPPPSTMDAGPLHPVTAITVYATTASVATTCTQQAGKKCLVAGVTVQRAQHSEPYR